MDRIVLVPQVGGKEGQMEEWDFVEEFFHRFQDPKPDIVCLEGNWMMEREGKQWVISDHAIISGTSITQIKKKRLLMTSDWERWLEFIEDMPSIKTSKDHQRQ